MKVEIKHFYWAFPFVLGLIIVIQSLLLFDLQTGIPALSWEAVSDFLIFLPVSIYFLWQMAFHLRQNNKVLSVWFWVLLAVYIAGIGVHLSANQIHNFLDSTGVVGDVSQVAYLWDELIGHWLIHLGLAGILYLLALSSSDKGNKIIYGITGFILGVFLAVASIEGHSIWIYVAYVVVLWSSLLTKKMTSPGIYFLMSSVGIVLLLLGWHIVFDSFVEPSVLFRLTG